MGMGIKREGRPIYKVRGGERGVGREGWQRRERDRERAGEREERSSSERSKGSRRGARYRDGEKDIDRKIEGKTRSEYYQRRLS